MLCNEESYLSFFYKKSCGVQCTFLFLMVEEGVRCSQILSFDEGIYTVVLYFYMYYVLIWLKEKTGVEDG